MEVITIIGTIAAVVAAVVSILSLRDSKRNIYKRIEKKEGQIKAIEHKLISKYGLHGDTSSRGITSLDAKKEKLQKEIANLKRLL